MLQNFNMKTYTHSYSLTLDDIDGQNFRLTPLAAIGYMQDASARLTALNKMAYYDLLARNQYWVIKEMNISFIGERPSWAKEITVECWFSEITRLKVYIDFLIRVGSCVVARGSTLWLVIDGEKHQPVAVPGMQDLLKIPEGLAVIKHSRFVLPETIGECQSFKRVARESDTDFNGHVNNKRYLQFALRLVADETQDKTLLELQARFNQEVFEGEVLNCTAYKTYLSNRFVHIMYQHTTPVCEVVTSWSGQEGG